MGARGGWWRTRVGSVLLALLFVSGSTLSARAADEPLTRVPEEPGVAILPGVSLDAVTVDLTGDGARELVRLRAGPETFGAVAVEAWTLGADGWEAMSGPWVVRREARVGEFAPKRIFTVQSELAEVLPREPARFVVVREGGRERLIVAVAGEPGTDRACCLTVWEVLADGSLRLLPVEDTAREAESLVAVDLTADGDDELLVISQPDLPLEPPATLQVLALRVEAERLTPIDRAEVAVAPGSRPVRLGDSDGRPGEEVGLLDAGQERLAHRISLDADQRLHHEAIAAPVSGWMSALASAGDVLVALGGPQGTYVARWPSGDDLEILSAAAFGGELVALVGEGSTQRLAIADADRPLVHLLDTDLRPHGSLPRSAAAAAVDGTPVRPFDGALPMSTDPTAVGQAVYGGRLLSSDSPLDSPSTIASLAGAQPIGALGGGEWLALLHTFGPWFELAPEGGLLIRNDLRFDGQITIVPIELVLRAEEAGGRLDVPLTGGAPVPAPGGLRRVLTGPDGAVAVIEAPPGSRVIQLTEVPRDSGEMRVGIVGSAGTARLALVPPQQEDGSRANVRLVVLTPAGHAYSAEWRVEVRDRPPELSATATTTPWSFQVPVAGWTDADASVLVDGHAASVAADGSFEVRVPATLWPRTVVLEATDPLGNRAVETLSVVGFADYRRLPWLPIVALLTLAAATVLVLRAPRPRAVRSGSGTILEEIEDDASGQG